MTAPISGTTPAPDYPASFRFSDGGHRQSDVQALAICATLPNAYVAHLARTQAREQVSHQVDVNQADLNLDADDIFDGHIVDRLIQDYDLVATTTMTITHAVGNRILSRWHSYVSLVGTATTSFTDDDGQTHTMTTVCDIALDHTMFVGTAHHRGYGQLLGLSPEQILEMENLTNPRSVVTYLDAQCEQEPLVIPNLTWKIADII